MTCLDWSPSTGNLLGSVRYSAFHKCIFYIPFRQNCKRVLPFSARSNRNLHNEKSCHDDKLIEISKFFSFPFLWTYSTNHWPLKQFFLFNLCTWTPHQILHFIAFYKSLLLYGTCVYFAFLCMCGRLHMPKWKQVKRGHFVLHIWKHCYKGNRVPLLF